MRSTAVSSRPTASSAAPSSRMAVRGGVSAFARLAINYATFSKMLEGHLLADTVAILGSINIIAAG